MAQAEDRITGRSLHKLTAAPLGSSSSHQAVTVGQVVRSEGEGGEGCLSVVARLTQLLVSPNPLSMVNWKLGIARPSFLALPLRLPCGRWAWWDRSTIITHLPTSFRTHRVFVPTWCGSFLLHFRSYTLHCPSAPVVHHDTSAWEVSPPLTELVPLGLAGFDATSPQGAAPQHELGWCCDLRAESRIVLYVSFERGVGCVMFSPPVVAKAIRW
nr:uncharacterized protein LOC112291822 [Physcomitrium patens]|eukprot:XP_024395500.1 uncharacterized protein LOC112291822 [Physcomitrella patens]